MNSDCKTEDCKCKTVKLKEYEDLKEFTVNHVLSLEDAVDVILDVLCSTVKLDRKSFYAMCQAKAEERIKLIKQATKKED